MPEQTPPLVELAGSERAPLAATAPAGQLDTSERAEVTLVLRRRAELPAGIVEGPTVLTSEQLAEQYGADPADVMWIWSGGQWRLHGRAGLGRLLRPRQPRRHRAAEPPPGLAGGMRPRAWIAGA